MAGEGILDKLGQRTHDFPPSKQLSKQSEQEEKFALFLFLFFICGSQKTSPHMHVCFILQMHLIDITDSQLLFF